MDVSYEEGVEKDTLRQPRGAVLRPSPESVALAGAAFFVASTAVALWLSSGLRVGEILGFLAYELGFVLVPGWLVFRAVVSPPGGRLQQLVLGWALGYVLEIAAFLAASASGARGAFVVYPLAVGVPAALIAWLRRRDESHPESAVAARSRGVRVAVIWTGAAICSLLLFYAAMVGFTQNPLPRDVASVTYQEDTVFAISLAGEALHHWPVTLPTVAGEPLDYHLFVYLHMAAVGDVTGIDLSVVVLRLYQVPLLLLFALQLFWAGRRLGRSLSAGLVGAALVLFLGELDASVGTEFLFSDFFFFWLVASHTFLLGLVFFVPAIVLLGDLLTARERQRRTRAQEWALVAALVVGCVGAKSYAPLLVLFGGLVVFVLWQLWRERELSRPALGALGLCALVYVGASALLLGWNRGGGELDPLTSFERMTAVIRLDDYFERSWGGFDSQVFDVALGTVGLLGVPILGIALLLGYRRLTLSGTEAWFLSLFVAALPALYFLVHPGYSHLFIVFFGAIPGLLLAGVGFLSWWERSGRASVNAVTLGAVAFVGWVTATLHLSEDDVVWLGVLFAGVTIAALLYLTGRLTAPAVGRSLVTALVGSTLLLGLLNTPLDWLPTLSDRNSEGRPLYNQEFHGLTSGLYRGLRWIRDNTDEDAVLVVNNHTLHPDGSDSKYFYYSAFAERRVVLESWDYTPQTAASGRFSLPVWESPFPERFELSRALFEDADGNALRVLACEYGATHLVVDKAHDTAMPTLGALTGPGSRLYSNWDLDVYRVPVRTLCGSARDSTAP